MTMTSYAIWNKFYGNLIVLCLPFTILGTAGYAETVIRINQLGYLPQSVKVAVLLSDEDYPACSFQLIDAKTGDLVATGTPQQKNAAVWGKKTAWRLPFTDWQEPGEYRLKVGDTESPMFKISVDVYDGTADYVLRYMRQQRCGDNPYLDETCHADDGIIVDHPARAGEQIDVVGGWHDATDYLQYTCTSANAVYQMLFAYRENPAAFKDHYDATGRPGANGIPDVLDEARWGLDWLVKMNPAPGEMYNQIADDRDHQGMRFPNKDTVDYGFGKARPVYFVTGKPQGLGRHKNRSTGVSSTAAKFASSFALGSETFRSIDPEFSELLLQKSLDAWEFAKSDPGVCQTACMVSPYFYEEDNYVDDMELAATTFFLIHGKTDFRRDAKYWGELEPVTPWMELNRARHYQYYPFVNLGHLLLTGSHDNELSTQFASYVRQGLEAMQKRTTDEVFPVGVPWIWCSSNLVVATATQGHYYRQVTGDRQFEEMEAAQRDWLFGCNPWGTSMVCGLPEHGDFPRFPHSSYTNVTNETTHGGLVDGPVYRSIFESLLGIRLHRPDEYANYQGGIAVYHDDIGDYSTNEPTMDGTASLCYLLSALEIGKN